MILVFLNLPKQLFFAIDNLFFDLLFVVSVLALYVLVHHINLLF